MEKRQDRKAMGVSRSFWKRLVRDFRIHKWKYVIVLPVLIYLALFCYKPMYGILIAFQNYRPTLGVKGSQWVGLAQFKSFFQDVYFWRILRNTFAISGLSILFGFPMPILLALMLNEVRSKWFKRTVQTVSYMPYFVSTVVVCSLIRAFCSSKGVFNDVIALFGGTRMDLLYKSEYFYPIYILSGIWQSVGWDSIIYLAALSGIDQEQYEAARVDGAGRLRQMVSITLPGLAPTIVILFILRMGGILNVGYEKILLLYQPLTYEVADVISTYVYRRGIVETNFSYSTAVGLFNSVVNVVFLLTANWLSRKSEQTGLF